jgi:hypothetical protein
MAAPRVDVDAARCDPESGCGMSAEREDAIDRWLEAVRETHRRRLAVDEAVARERAAESALVDLLRAGDALTLWASGQEGSAA